MPDDFSYDIFLSHSSKDKAVVREVAERLKNDGIKVWFDEWLMKAGDSIPHKIDEGLEQSRVLVLCMSANAFGSDWAELESQTFRFRDPLNKERRFIPVRLDDAPIKGSLAQFFYISWCADDRNIEYKNLLEACRPPVNVQVPEGRPTDATVAVDINPNRQAPLPTMTIGDANAEIAQSNSQQLADRREAFDLDQFAKLKNYAYGSGGLNLDHGAALRWAEERLKDSPPFDLEKFINLKNYAYGSGGLNLGHAAAVRWAEERLKDSPPFDLEKFINLKNYAYGSSGLNLDHDAAIRWAEERLKDSPPFDLEKFINLKNYAYGSSGLNLDHGAAVRWAMSHMK